MIVDGAIALMLALFAGNVFGWELYRRSRVENAAHRERETAARELIRQKNAQIDAELDRADQYKLKYDELALKIAEKAKEAPRAKKRPPTIPEWRATRKKVSEGEVSK